MCQESESHVGIKVQNILQLHLLTTEDNEGITGRYVVLEPSWVLIQLFKTLGHNTEVSISKTCTFSPVLTAFKTQKIGLKMSVKPGFQMARRWIWNYSAAAPLPPLPV